VSTTLGTVTCSKRGQDDDKDSQPVFGWCFREKLMVISRRFHYQKWELYGNIIEISASKPGIEA
jgi:hypothetical protein